MGTKTVSVEVPEERLADFYLMFGHWHSAADAVIVSFASLTRPSHPSWSPEDQALMDALRTDLVFDMAADEVVSTLTDQPGVAVPWRVVGSRCGAATSSAVAQLAINVAMKCAAHGRRTFLHWLDAGDGPAYWIEPDVAEMWIAADPFRNADSPDIPPA